MFFAKALKFYKHRKIQEAIVRECENKEVAVKYDDSGFGRRPDILQQEGDVLDFAQKRATSFHISEELWENPLALKPAMPRRELDNLRIGWDFVLDIDCKDWDISRRVSYVFIKALEAEGIKNINCKFSGNKGFHIAVPFEAFPKQINGKRTSDLFPEAPKAMASLLLKRLGEEFIKIDNDKIIFADTEPIQLKVLLERLGLKKEELVINVCAKCGRIFSDENVNLFVCKRCGHRVKSSAEYLNCERCSALMERFESKKECVCGGTDFSTIIDIKRILKLDTLLLSSRHMFRAPYSMHEKSLLVSLPIDKEEVLNFDKTKATTKSVLGLEKLKRFMNRNVVADESERFLSEALKLSEVSKTKKEERVFEPISEAIGEENFPPCIKNILAGLKDGRKRALFVLVNFLKTVGWGKKSISDLVIEWNKRNTEPLRETTLVGHINYHMSRKGSMPPPNCRQFYQELGVCRPDDLCRTIKNPVMYALKKSRRKDRGGKRALKDISELWDGRFIEEDFEIRNRDCELLKGIIAHPKRKKKGFEDSLLIVCHGYLHDKNKPLIKAIARFFAAKGLDTIRFDFSGNGESEGITGKTGFIKQERDLEDVFNHFKDNYKRVIVAGHSMGGEVAVHFAGVNKDVSGIIDIAGVMFPKLLADKFGEEKINEAYEKGEVKVKTSAGEIVFFKEYFDQIKDAKPLKYAKNIKIPVLILHGGEDTSVPMNNSKALFQTLSGRRSMRVINKADHSFSSEGVLKKLLNEIYSWLKIVLLEDK